ncbi:pectate lyase [Halogranum rubrum]|uniref:Pectate lyase n=1 Tax=Halogranum rubrum TaxID=553466 RepID=A0A1I4HPV2_9EURY|nr:pectate lyase [Halogranum rubrum]SFL44195.1 pectate lyase [Halogranum rubrum]
MTLPATLVDSIRTHADTVVEHGRDRYGDERTPLLADALDGETMEALPYDARDVDGDRRLSNFAFQQEFLRVLVGLTRLTGTREYSEEAATIVTWVFDELTDDAGLVYWGGHAAYDLDRDEVVVHKDSHELKFEYPFYEFLWEVDEARTRQFIETFWEAHVREWETLDFNRHGAWTDEPDVDATSEVPSPWNHEYEGGDVFFWGDGLTFVNTGSDLYYAAGVLASLTDDDGPLAWSENLARRYVETRQEPGISGYQFSQHPSYCDGPSIRGDRAQYQFAPYIHGDHLVYEGTLFRPRPIVQRQQLTLGERLGERGTSFTQWAVEELRAWRQAAYRPETNDFEPMLTDGFSLEGFVCRRDGYFGPKGRIVGPIEAGSDFFWLYAQAYRATGDSVCWQMVLDIARGLGLGHLGPQAGSPEIHPTDTAEPLDFSTLYGLLELYEATGRDPYLEAAATVGRELHATGFDDSAGAFVDERGRILLDDPRPLALLHLATVLRDGERTALPTPVGDRRTPTGGI